MKPVGEAPGLPFSPGMLHDSKFTLEVSGQVGLKDGKLVEGVEAQTEQSLQNMKRVLQQAGWDFSNVVKTKIYLVSMDDYAAVNEVYAKHFSENPPARVALAVNALPLGALIEIECVAAGDQ